MEHLLCDKDSKGSFPKFRASLPWTDGVPTGRTIRPKIREVSGKQGQVKLPTHSISLILTTVL